MGVVKVRVDQFQRGASAIGRFGPGAMVVVRDLVDQPAPGVLDRHPLAAIVKTAARKRPQHAADPMDAFDRRRVVTDDDIAARGDRDPSREGIHDAVAEPPAGEIDVYGAGVIQLDVFLAVVVGRGVVLQLVDDDLWARLGGHRNDREKMNDK